MKGHRPERVANVVRQVVSDAISNKLSDPRIAPFTSVTRVDVTHDLEYAKVWISVMGSDGEQRRTLAGLRSAGGLVQRMVASDLKIRVCPRLSFHLDESLKKAAEINQLIDESMAEIRQRAGDPAEPPDDPEAPNDSAAPDDSDGRAPGSSLRDPGNVSQDRGGPLPSDKRPGDQDA
jgi:ribosome-binding factor A